MINVYLIVSNNQRLRFFESYINTHKYKHLQAYSKFLLDHFLEELVAYQAQLSKEIKLPLLRLVQHLPEEQVKKMGIDSMTESLVYLSNDQPRELIELYLNRWKQGQLNVLGKSDIMAEDITMINFVREQAFNKFIIDYTSDVHLILEISNEINAFFAVSTTATLNTYIEILREDLQRQGEALLEAQRIAGMGSFEWDIISNKTYRSPEAERIFGTDEHGVDAFCKFIYEPDRDKVELAIRDAMASGNLQTEFRVMSDREMRYVWAKAIVHFEEGKPRKMVGTVQDITERKNTEDALIEKTVALERSNESLQQFAFVASHDLQEPMRQISTFADIVLSSEKYISEGSRGSLQKIVNAAIRMRRMIDDILAYSTLTQWEGKEDFELADILVSALDNLEQKVEEKSATIQHDKLPRIYAVPSQIQQLLQNLISNALKFSRPGVPPAIKIYHEFSAKEVSIAEELRHSDKYLKLTVEDNGIGFDEKFAHKIFGLFSRLHNKKDYQGSGIGLAIAKKIVNNHGGVLTASSIKGQGASFTIILPQ